MKFKIWTVLFLIIVVCISAGMLNAIHFYTDPIAQKNARIKIQRSILEIFGIPYEETSVEEAFKENIYIDTKTVEGFTIYRTEAGIAFEISGPGFWETISVLIALEPDLETIKGLRILKHAETPGLGGRITESWFQDQFKGKKLVPDLKIVSHKKAEGPNQVDAITGATETSKALERMINNNVRAFYQKINSFGK